MRCQTNGHQGITISDNGIGIKEEFRDKIFLPFKRFHNDKEYEGTGLGLSIVSKVMEKHKGSIEIKETSDRGTTFKLLFSKN
jgi:signal transduction histidine kinase